jgi:hypothetical protein
MQPFARSKLVFDVLQIAKNNATILDVAHAQDRCEGGVS